MRADKSEGGNMKSGIVAFGAVLLAGSAYAQVPPASQAPAAAQPAPRPARAPQLTCTPTPGQPVECRNANAPDWTPAFPQQTRAPYAPSNVTLNVETLVEGLEFPWGLAPLPDGRFLVTEKAGTMRIISGHPLSP